MRLSRAYLSTSDYDVVTRLMQDTDRILRRLYVPREYNGSDFCTLTPDYLPENDD
jgi:hypothetical protein